MPGLAWTRVSGTIVARRTDDRARFVLLMEERGGVALDVISLFPRKTFHHRPNGLRADLAQAIADLLKHFGVPGYGTKKTTGSDSSTDTSGGPASVTLGKDKSAPADAGDASQATGGGDLNINIAVTVQGLAIDPQSNVANVVAAAVGPAMERWAQQQGISASTFFGGKLT